MSTARIKLILVWSLFAAYCVLFGLHHRFLAQFVFLAALIVRLGISRPKPSARERRIVYGIAWAFILFLVLLLIHNYRPFPPAVVTAGEIIGVLILVPMLLHGIYSDYVLFKSSRDTSTQ
jgi:hypothetical protein